MLIETIIEDPRWTDFGLDAIAQTAGKATLEALGLPVQGFLISLLGCNDERITLLNADFRDKAKATNVLSWPSKERAAEFVGEDPIKPEPGEADDPEPLGDIAISFETCMKEAGKQSKTPEHHVTHLMVHGILHLLGYDHIEEEDAQLMEAHEVRILAQLGISDPY